MAVVKELQKLIELYGHEISTDIPEEIYDYVYLNLKRIQYYREEFDIPVVGISGKHGKTITKKMLSTILSTKGKVLETPLYSRTATNITSTLIRLSDEYKYAILEFGIQYDRQFKLAVEISKPTIGIITNIGESHYAYLGSQKVVSEIKAELIKSLPPDGVSILNVDDDLANMLGEYCPSPNVIKFGLNPSSHFYATDIEYLGPEGIRFNINTLYPAHLKIYSISEVYNVLAAISAARALGFDIEESISILESNLEMPAGRGNLIKMHDYCLLDFSYDASPDSITKAAKSLSDFKNYSKKLIMVVGELGEFGKKTDEYHLNAGYYLGALPISSFITVGPKAKLIAKGIRKVNGGKKEIVNVEENEPQQIMNHINGMIEPESAVLVTGRNQQKLGDLVQLIKDSTSAGS